MMTRFRLATPVQVVVMTLAWLGALVAIDYAKSPRLRAADPTPAKPGTVALGLWINHLCCTSCLEVVRDALVTIPWIDPQSIRPRQPVKSNEQASSAGETSDEGGWIDVGVADLEGLDFVQIDRVLREHGMVASRIEFGGLQHFRLEASVRCCGRCEQAVDRLGTIDRARPTARLRWVDSMTTDPDGQRVTVHARYQGPEDVIDVADLLGTFDEAGLPALSLRVRADSEQPDRSGHVDPPGAPAHQH
jgi:hypothetical protein